VLGWQMFAALTAPLLYLFFLVPFGAFLTPALQDFTAVFIDVGLKVLGIPHYSDAYIIEIPEGPLLRGRGLRGIALPDSPRSPSALLYACLMYRSLSRRLAFMAASIIIPIIANGIRALGIVVLAMFSAAPRRPRRRPYSIWLDVLLHRHHAVDPRRPAVSPGSLRAHRSWSPVACSRPMR